ncbi:MAG: NlpC/P60 family protein [Coprobacillus sp.]
MNKKQFTISMISLFLLTSLFTYTQYAKAEDFAGKEDKYIKLCSSSKLTSSQQKTCKEFNTYLSKKNKDLSKEAANAKKESQKTQESIEDVASEITALDKKIESANKELDYIQSSIKKLNQNITEKKQELAERMYSMQTITNSHSYITYLFSAESFSDFFSRLASFKEITNYENELISNINNDIAEAEKQEATTKSLNNSLTQDKLAQADLQKQLATKLKEQNKTIADNTSEVSKNQESIESIQSNLAAIQKATDESKVNNVTQATPSKKPSTPSQGNSTSKPSTPNTTPDNSNTTKPDTPNTTTPDNSQDNNTSNEDLGLKIANKALTRQGYMYVWGGSHSWSAIQNPNQTQFDCSGLVNWAFYQSGVDLGRIHYTGSLITAGKSVSKGNLQAGDIILFSSNGSVSGVHHVGIYIGNNQMVHAPSTGKPVQVSNLSNSYWQNEWYSCRRLY